MQELCELGLNAKRFEMSTPSSFLQKVRSQNRLFMISLLDQLRLS